MYRKSQFDKWFTNDNGMKYKIRKVEIEDKRINIYLDAKILDLRSLEYYEEYDHDYNILLQHGKNIKKILKKDFKNFVSWVTAVVDGVGLLFAFRFFVMLQPANIITVKTKIKYFFTHIPPFFTLL